MNEKTLNAPIWDRRISSGWLLPLLLIGVFIVLLALPNPQRDPGGVQKAEVRQNLHAIQLAVERYAFNNPQGSYPMSLSQLRHEGYLPELPPNPYNKGRRAVPMSEVPLGQHAPGGVTYVPLVVDIVDEASGETRSEVQGYALLVYGDKSRRGGTEHIVPLPHGAESQAAWEYVLMTLSSGWRIPPSSEP